MDPQQRLLLEVCWEALEHAGIAARPAVGQPRPASSSALPRATTPSCCCKARRPSRGSTRYFASGIAHSIASGRLSYILGLQGPSISIDTACSSSLVAVHLACQSLRAGECRMALAGGVNLILSPDHGIALLEVAHAGRRTAAARPSTRRADGFVPRRRLRRGGAQAAVATRVADGDRISRVIRGSAVNQDGPSSGLTAPNGPAQEAVIREALATRRRRAARRRLRRGPRHRHALGDPIEVQALGAVLGDGRPADRPLCWSAR